jgi:hypothetical protein
MVMVLALGAHHISGQDFSTQARSEVIKFDFMVGKSIGDGWNYSQHGIKEKTSVFEDIRYDLDSTTSFIVGEGMSVKNGEKIKSHDALGVLSYDVFQNKFKMNSWIHNGMFTTANVEYKGEGNFVWWFKAEPMTMRSTVIVIYGKWQEIGKMTSDDRTWRQFFEMNLLRVLD